MEFFDDDIIIVKSSVHRTQPVCVLFSPPVTYHNSQLINSIGIKNKKFELMLTRCVKAYSMPMLICNRFHKRWYWPTSENSNFYRGTVLWCPRAQVFLNLKNRDLDRWNLRSMLKILYAACPCLSQLVSAQFALEMCLAARNCQKIHKTPYFDVEGHSRSLNSAPIESQFTTSY